MNDDQLRRYARHLLLDEVGFEGQEAWCQAKVLVIGAGGLGCSALAYLAASGVGQITVMDDDEVELSNLQRQILHTQTQIGKPKVVSAEQALHQINPEVQVQALCQRYEATEACQQLLMAHDLVLDCSDNFPTRLQINRDCVRFHKPLVSGAAVQLSGQVFVYDPQDPHSACYQCLYPEGTQLPPTDCATWGVLAPLVGLIGSFQALLALQYLLPGDKPPELGRVMWYWDTKTLQWHRMKRLRLPACTVCSKPE